jgi:hypothetical protein
MLVKPVVLVKSVVLLVPGTVVAVVNPVRITVGTVGAGTIMCLFRPQALVAVMIVLATPVLLIPVAVTALAGYISPDP